MRVLSPTTPMHHPCCTSSSSPHPMKLSWVFPWPQCKGRPTRAQVAAFMVVTWCLITLVMYCYVHHMLSSIYCARVMDGVVSLFLSSYSGLPSGESDSQVVNLNNLTWMAGERTPFGSGFSICSLLWREMSCALQLCYFLIKEISVIWNTTISKFCSLGTYILG